MNILNNPENEHAEKHFIKDVKILFTYLYIKENFFPNLETFKILTKLFSKVSTF